MQSSDHTELDGFEMAGENGTIISRSDAIAGGLNYYFTGLPCANGHVARRIVSKFTCYACKAARNKRQYYADLDRTHARASAWRARNRTRILDREQRHRDANKERINCQLRNIRTRNHSKYLDDERTRHAKYRKDPGYVAKRIVENRNRRARLSGNGGSHTTEDIADIMRMQRGKCACCAVKLKQKYHVDHIIPVIEGGANDRRNLQILCPPCNQAKAAKDPINFMRQLGRLL